MCLLVLWAGCRQNTRPGVREQRPSPFATHLLDLPDFPQTLNYLALFQVAVCFCCVKKLLTNPVCFHLCGNLSGKKRAATDRADWPLVTDESSHQTNKTSDGWPAILSHQIPALSLSFFFSFFFLIVALILNITFHRNNVETNSGHFANPLSLRGHMVSQLIVSQCPSLPGCSTLLVSEVSG